MRPSLPLKRHWHQIKHQYKRHKTAKASMNIAQRLNSTSTVNLQNKKSNERDRPFSYSSYSIPKNKHIQNKNFGKIQNNFGYAGEDSYFSVKNHNNLFIGVADGVGSFKSEKAKSAAHYAQKLMSAAIEYLSENICVSKEEEGIDNKNISHKIAEYSSNYVTDNELDGASTLCIANIESHHNNNNHCTLNAFNLGDSGFSVYRTDNSFNNGDDKINYSLIYSAPSQAQGFGIPFQIGSHPTANTIDDGFFLNRFNLKSNDIIVFGTDGLWDNLWQYQIINCINKSIMRYYDYSRNNKNETFKHYIHTQIVKGDLNNRLLKEAYSNSLSRNISTPWSESMTETVDMIYNGGKQDDITLIVVFIH